MSRVPPHNIDAEQSVIGAIFLRNEALSDVELDAEEFYDPRHRAIFAAIRRLEALSKPIDPVTIETELPDAIALAYLSECTGKVPTADNISHYATIVASKAAVRRVMIAASEIASAGYGDPDSAEYLERAERLIMQAAERRGGGGPIPLSKVMLHVFRNIENRASAKDGVTGIPSGFVDLDAMTAGFQPGELVVVAGRPGQGKTALAMNSATNAALGSNVPVLVFSLEMPADQLGERVLASEGRIDSQMLRRGQVDGSMWVALRANAERLATEDRITIDDTAAISLSELRSRAMRWRSRNKAAGMVVIDYLQLMRVRGLTKGHSREQEIAEISRGLKALAKELRCPVMALSQLNRAGDQRADRRPIMSDLRESGQIEQDADLIIGLYRDESNPGEAEAIILKARSGPTGTVKLAFSGSCTRFDNLSVASWDDL